MTELNRIESLRRPRLDGVYRDSLKSSWGVQSLESLVYDGIIFIEAHPTAFVLCSPSNSEMSSPSSDDSCSSGAAKLAKLGCRVAAVSHGEGGDGRGGRRSNIYNNFFPISREESGRPR